MKGLNRKARKAMASLGVVDERLVEKSLRKGRRLAVRHDRCPKTGKLVMDCRCGWCEDDRVIM